MENLETDQHLISEIMPVYREGTTDSWAGGGVILGGSCGLRNNGKENENYLSFGGLGLGSGGFVSRSTMETAGVNPKHPKP